MQNYTGTISYSEKEMEGKLEEVRAQLWGGGFHSGFKALVSAFTKIYDTVASKLFFAVIFEKDKFFGREHIVI